MFTIQILPALRRRIDQFRPAITPMLDDASTIAPP
jgi:hypothetical protein